MRAAGTHKQGRQPDLDRYKRALELHDAGRSCQEIADALGQTLSNGRATLNRARWWRERVARETGQSVRDGEPEYDFSGLASRVGALEASVAKLVGVLTAIAEHPTEPAGAAPEVLARLDAIAKRLDVLEAPPTVANVVPIGKRYQKDTPREMIRQQLEVIARELGPIATAELLPVGAESIRKLLDTGALPRVDGSEVDRAYVVVRMAQLDIEADDDDVLAVGRAIRARQKAGAGAKAWGEAS